MMLNGFGLDKTPGAAATVATGAGSGILNGAFGMGGPPVVLFYFSTPAAAAVGRASVIAFFLSTDNLGLGELARNGLVTMQSLAQFIAWLPALLIGVAVGDQGVQAHGSGEIPPCRAGHPDRPRRPYIGEGRLRPQRLTDRQCSTMGTVAKLKREMVANAKDGGALGRLTVVSPAARKRSRSE